MSSSERGVAWRTMYATCWTSSVKEEVDNKKCDQLRKGEEDVEDVEEEKLRAGGGGKTWRRWRRGRWMFSVLLK